MGKANGGKVNTVNHSGIVDEFVSDSLFSLFLYVTWYQLRLLDETKQ